ncbi:MAG: hypothetical protein LBE57_04785 [Methanosarcinales archaeon]|jgi:hypothetical protein|nr:hypothetical protein [Methanosarcinales archaeon]
MNEYANLTDVVDEAWNDMECAIDKEDIENILDSMEYHIAYGQFLRKYHLKLMRYEGYPDNDIREIEQEINRLVEERLKKIKFTH